MRSVIIGAVAALLLFIVAGVSWSEARLTRRIADAHLRLATLHYDPEDDIDSAMSIWNRVPLPVPSASADVKVHRATVSYWLSRYDSLADMTMATGNQAVNDPALLLIAANASFRNSAPNDLDRKSAVERLDGVIQQYAEVLRKDATQTDAAFNFEYVSKMRDTLAKGPGRAGRDKKAPEKAPLVSVDLPTGVTIHGTPGGPPDGTDMSDFKTITPMRYDEREEQMDPGRGKELRRKG